MLLVLVVFQTISFIYGEFHSMEVCEKVIEDDETNYASTFQCLRENFNLTKTLEDVMWKMNQIQQLLNQISDDQKYKPSPFKNIDDILKAPIGISHQNCQAKRQILRAIRRKLEWYNVMNDKETTTLFAWPSKSDVFKPEVSNLNSNRHLMGDYPKALNGIRCLLAKAIRKTGNKLSF
ncbi:hypothetical protein KR084_006069 [Drosophila pseudotakahashii]|nr:hypothetical protein KR084_006069 [Drosophila pseudotakahashii]